VSDIKPGLVVGGRFRLLRFIAAGGMGEVHEGIDTTTQARVAIKLLHAQLAQDREWTHRFEREAQVAVAIDSKHVARTLGAGTSKQARRPWIAFEFLEGESMDVLLKQQPRPPFSDVSRIVQQMLLGLEAAHQAGVIHRDIKPANLFLEAPGGNLRILDFGIAKVTRAGAPTSGLTRLDDSFGTPAYMSPEQLRSAKDVDPRTDLYSAGSVAFRLLTGRLPFDQKDPLAMLSMKETGGVPSLALASGVSWPPEIDAWFAHMLAHRREERFVSAFAAKDAWLSAARGMATHRPIPVEREELQENTDVLPPSFRGA